MTEQQTQVQAALAHITDACASLTREQCMVAGIALQAGWLNPDERSALADVAAGFKRLSVAGAPS